MFIFISFDMKAKSTKLYITAYKGFSSFTFFLLCFSVLGQQDYSYISYCLPGKIRVDNFWEARGHWDGNSSDLHQLTVKSVAYKGTIILPSVKTHVALSLKVIVNAFVRD